jgi:hypothetical protein
MNKNFVIIALLITLVSVTIYSFPLRTISEAKKLSFNSAVCVYKNGILTAPCMHNAMMNTGLNWTRDLIGNAIGSNAMKYIAVGNTTTAETVTLASLPGEITDCGMYTGANRYAGTYTVQTVSQDRKSVV